jgi:hypothetical protein
MMMVASSGLVMVEVPSWEYNRVHGVSNLNAVRDGLRVLAFDLGEHAGESATVRASVRGQPLGDHSEHMKSLVIVPGMRRAGSLIMRAISPNA